MRRTHAIGLIAFLTLALSAAPAQATFPGRNGKLAVTLEEGSKYPSDPQRHSLRVVSPRSRETWTILDCYGRNLDALPCRIGDTRFSPDGGRLAMVYSRKIGESWSQDREHGIGLIAPDGSGFQFARTSWSEPVVNLAWSPAGTQMLFQRQEDEQSPLVLMVGFPDGRESHPLVDARAYDGDWSSRGTIAYTGCSAPEICDIYAMRPGGSPRRVTYKGGMQPSWSPDGRRIAFVRPVAAPEPLDAGDWEPRADIYIVRSDGRRLRRLTWRSDTQPVWSPDGKRIAFIRKGGLYVVRRDGRKLRRILARPRSGSLVTYAYPDWQARPEPSR